MVYVLLGTGFEETEAIAPIDLLRRANIDVLTVGLNGKTVYGGHGIGIVTDLTPEEMDMDAMDMIVLPGGLGGVASIRGSEAAMAAIQYAYENRRFVAAICAAPIVLAQLGITDGQPAVCYPGCEGDMGNARIVPDAPCVRDGRIITGASAGCAISFGLALIEALRGAEVADAVAQQIVIR